MRLWGCLELHLASLSGAEVVHRRRRWWKSRWITVGRSERETAVLRWTTLLGVALCAVMFLVGTVQLVEYGLEQLFSALSSQRMRQEYYAVDVAENPIMTPASPSAPPAEPQQQPQVQTASSFADTIEFPAVSSLATDAPEATEIPETLKMLAYPDNRGLVVSSRFRSVRQQNADVVGWLKVDGMLDEPVVQRDNIYYMTHDYQGKQNANGTIFLDEIIDLEYRPYTLILYGHNMRSGAKFGSLRNYENLAYYRANPFITFDSIYEEGRYVVFAAALVSVEDEELFFLDVAGLISRNTAERYSVLTMLREASVIDTGVTVRPDDQVLLLVTCVGEASERRVIAARRLREGETAEDIAAMVQNSRTR